MAQSPIPEIPVISIFTILRPSTRPQSIAEQSSNVVFTLAEPGAQSRIFEELSRLKLLINKKNKRIR